MYKSVIIFFSILLLGSCTNQAEKARRDSIRIADSIARVKAAEEAAAAAALAMEQARKDSIRQLAFKDDSLMEKHIVVDKPTCMLYVRENGETIMEFPVCLGRGIGQKMVKGDHKTPEGKYKVISREIASGWTHDFHDGKGKVKGAYGPWFFRLNTPQSTHIGIHGCLDPESVGKRESDGCVRLRNEDLDSLQKQVKVGMTVIINPDK